MTTYALFQNADQNIIKNAIKRIQKKLEGETEPVEYPKNILITNNVIKRSDRVN